MPACTAAAENDDANANLQFNSFGNIIWWSGEDGIHHFIVYNVSFSSFARNFFVRLMYAN